MKNLTSILAGIMLILMALACSDQEVKKANTAIDEANKFVDTANENTTKAEQKFKDFEKKITDISGNDEVDKVRDFGKELFPLYDAMSENFKKAGDKFDEASKFKVTGKFKEYLEMKAKEMKLRSDYALEMKKIPQALIDEKTKKEYETSRDKIKENAGKILKDAKDSAEKAEQIRKDNPKIFDQN